MQKAGLIGLADRLKRLSAHADPLEELSRIMDFPSFRSTPAAVQALMKGRKGRPPASRPCGDAHRMRRPDRRRNAGGGTQAAQYHA